MKPYKKWGAALALVLIFALLSGCGTNEPQSNLLTTWDHYAINVLVVKEGDSYLPLYQQLSQSLVVGVSPEALEVKELDADHFHNYQVIYLHHSAQGLAQEKKLLKALQDYVVQGGTLVVPHDLMGLFSTDFTGITQGETVDLMETQLEYPALGKDYQGIQEVAKLFEEDYRNHVKKPTALQAATLQSATAIVGTGSRTLISYKAHGKGQVINLSDFLPNYKEYITAYDLVHRGEANNYFHFFTASGNNQMLGALMANVGKLRYGVAFKKVLGTYGSPAMAWQNHYEALSSFRDKEMITWIDMLKEHNQIPTFTLIRGSYDWGEWYATLTYHINKGEAQEPAWTGEELNSFYSNGTFIKDSAEDYHTFGKYPEYVSYYTPIEALFRPYPAMVDYTGDGKFDLLVGTPAGEIMLLKNQGSLEAPQYPTQVALKGPKGTPLSLGTDLAPTAVANGKGSYQDLIIGNGAGALYYIENSPQGMVNIQEITDAQGNPIRVSGAAAPFSIDWDRDGNPDLLIGNDIGTVVFARGLDQKGTRYEAPIPLTVDQGPVAVDTFSAPHGVDYNQDGLLDLLVGDGKGNIHLFLGAPEGLESQGPLPTERKNIYGANTFYTGKNVVPLMVDYNGDGKLDLITGQLSFALAYDTASEAFPYKKELREALDYARENSVPIMPHVYFHAHKDAELERQELAQHQENFKVLGLPWEYTGTNQHTWRVNIDNPRQSFENLMAFNIWHDLAFKTPNAPSDPTFGTDYLWPMAFIMMEGEAKQPLLMSTPAPYLYYYEGVYEHLGAMDIPLSFFEHIEYKIAGEGTGIPHLNNMIALADRIKGQYHYAFMTEEQMAKALINSFYTDYKIQLSQEQLTITPDFTRVPKALAAEYLGTSGLRMELGEGWQHSFHGRPLVQYEGKEGYYFGVDAPVTFTLGETTEGQGETPVTFTMVNGPMSLAQGDNQLVVTLPSGGMQQIRLTSQLPLVISGEDLSIEQEGDTYQVTHYGEQAIIKIQWE